jgi:hypothetical protein
VIATAPQTVTIPVIAVLGAGLAVSTLIAMGDRWLARRGRRRADERHLAAPAARQPPGSASRGNARDNHDSDAAEEAAGWGALGVWGALGATSVSLLMLALVVDERLGAALAVMGLAGLAAFRVAAMYGGWLPRRPSALPRGASWGVIPPSAAVAGRPLPRRPCGSR